ncbi:hypothetical protein NDU88_006259 [Pleurodeles waltl]|uniref:Uncharacterized protein n=1 Tax=Pleurodeles waltl TaxID=8319 RepID=A0AAV7TF34_PLEWA|nr:hypothetical protein NDU88_006259 [Pleurodeles waltl]
MELRRWERSVSSKDLRVKDGEKGPPVKPLFWLMRWKQVPDTAAHLKYPRCSTSRVREAAAAGCRLCPAHPIQQEAAYGDKSAPLTSAAGRGTPRISWGKSE